MGANYGTTSGDQIGHLIPDACRKSGLSRTALYRELAAGRLKAVKAGRRTIILAESLRELIASLPPARFGKAGRHG